MDEYRSCNYQANPSPSAAGGGPFHLPYPPKAFQKGADPLRGDSPSLPVDRQDSLMLCQQLQEKDGFDFMDENMDLTPYLNNLQEFFDGDGNDDIEPILDKQRMLESDIYAQQYPYANSPLQYADLSTVDSSDAEAAADEIVKGMTKSPKVLPVRMPIKEETLWEEEAEDSLPTTSAKKEKSDQVEVTTYSPSIKPRKYSLKPEEEKKNPVYRLKREKNNDAVRKSRTKAKEQQRLKDEQIKDLQHQIQELGVQLTLKENRVTDLEVFVRELQYQNKEFSSENKRLKTELGYMKKFCRCSP